jgi:thioredoxin reductase (NADPH)
MTEQIRLIGADWCPDCQRSKSFLSQHRVPFEYVNIETTPEAVAEVEKLNDGKRIIPTIIFTDGSFLSEPSNDELADQLGLVREAMAESYDIVIAGGGPTALTTAIYAARENLSTLIIEKSALGGQAGVTERLDNYPGFPDGVSGAELASRFARQAERYDVEMLQAVSVQGFKATPLGVQVLTGTGQTIDARVLLVATGSTYRRTGAEGEADLIGAGIHFCATCDGPFYKGVDEVVVIGGGNSGLEEGMFLTQFAKHVTLFEYGDALKGSKLLQDKVLSHPRMTVKLQTQVVAFNADDDNKLASVTLKDLSTSETFDHPATGAFVFIGLDPNTSWLPGEVALDERGFVATDDMFMTTVPRVFAAGDVRRGSTKQLASAVGEGAAVAIQIRQFLEKH